ncbi:hypothetical protein M405DRAFT_140760 [Rhizopogon salebrosus TDB-379]|nr:hypothetical protein M405DRAFT_140760 [Rhizopogon salebrosus TDB-379]
MQYNQQAPWTPHHSASLSVVSPNRQAPRPRPRHTTLPGPPLLPQRPPPAFNDHSRHIPIPASLTPGRRPPAAGGGTRQSFSYNTSGALFVSPQHTSFYGDYFFSRPHPISPPPPVPQKPPEMTAPPLPLPRPPVPPRPPLINPVPLPRHPLYPTSIPGPIAGPSSQPMQTSEEPPTDDKDIALALALSESEARQREENIIAQEEADLMKALEESRLSDSGYSSLLLLNFRRNHAGPLLCIPSLALLAVALQ